MLFHVAIDAFAGGVMNALDAFQRFGEEGGNVLETLGGVIHGFVAEALNAVKRFTMELIVSSVKVVFAKQIEAIAGVIASVMKSVPFPLNLLLVGGAIATVSALFSGLTPKSYATGGYVPEETFAHLHAGERVLSAAEVRGQAVAGSHEIHNHFSFHINAFDGPDVVRVVEGKIMPALKKAYSRNVSGFAQSLSQEMKKF